jgi:PAS domain S-box-containing protein
MPFKEAVLDRLSIGVAALDNAGRYLYTNDNWSQFLNLAGDGALIGQSHFDVCKSFFTDKQFERVKSGKGVGDQISEIPGTDGKNNLILWGAEPSDIDDAACILIVHLSDGRDPMIRRMLMERERLKHAIDGADYGLWDWDVSTREVYFSKQYMKILGYDQYELPHNYDTWEILCKPEDLIGHDEAIKDYSANADGYLEDEFQMVRKDGSLIWILSRGKIVSRKPDGTPLRIVGTHQDITHKKEHEQQLIIAKEEAVQANKAKSDFLALISHEVRTPLNGITSILELLADENNAAERRRLSKIALNSSDQLLTVLSDVLDVSKMEAGQFDINPTPVKISDLLEELSQTHRKAAEAKGLTFSLEIDDESDSELMMDPVRVTQILNNFLSNATKFTESGAVAISVDIDENYDGEDSAQTFVSFKVQDDGIGLTPSERDSLFQPFYQAESTRSRSSEGTGLGLSICRNLALMMGGKVWCASKKGVGSTFYFEAAFDKAQTVEPALMTDSDQTSSVASGDVRLLAAEDNNVNQMLLQKFLVDRMGYQLTLTSNGEEVLKALESSDYDIVLMDIHMPVMDGVEATKIIRASNQTWSNIPIIALTADAHESHILEYQACGINTCVAKPIDWQSLNNTIIATVNTMK